MGFIFGGILIGIAVVLVIVRAVQASKLAQIKGTETSQAAALIGLAADVAKEIGAGSFTQIAELKGRAVADAPLKSELANADCVYYSMTVSREYEETYWQNDDKGNRVQRTRSGSEIVAQNKRSVPFYIDDGTGRIRVVPDGANFVTEKVMSRFQRGEAVGGSLSLGVVNFALHAIAGGRRTIGYRFNEDIIPVERDLYVLGEAADAAGALAIRKPADNKNRFIVSVKSEEELARGAAIAVLSLLIAAIVSGALGLTLIILGLVGVIK